jgi:hypothetical protein
LARFSVSAATFFAMSSLPGQLRQSSLFWSSAASFALKVVVVSLDFLLKIFCKVRNPLGKPVVEILALLALPSKNAPSMATSVLPTNLCSCIISTNFLVQPSVA